MEMADRSSHDLIHRLALIPKTMEARGLDVTPPIIEKFKQQKMMTLQLFCKSFMKKKFIMYLSEIFGIAGHVNLKTRPT